MMIRKISEQWSAFLIKKRIKKRKSFQMEKKTFIEASCSNNKHTREKRIRQRKILTTILELL